MTAFCPFESSRRPDGSYVHVAPCGIVRWSASPRYVRRCDCELAASGAKPRGELPLGDYLKAGLEKLGISQRRVARWLGSCGCAERQRKLNRLGSYVARRLASLASRSGYRPDGSQLDDR